MEIECRYHIDVFKLLVPSFRRTFKCMSAICVFYLWPQQGIVVAVTAGLRIHRMCHMDQSNTRVFEDERTVKSWDYDYYHPIAQSYYDQAILDTLRLMEAERGATVLDAGCGPGVHAIRIARAGYRVTAIDVSKTMLREALSRASAAGIESSIEFHCEDLTKLSFADASFRHVFSWGVLIHIREVERALDELARITEPGGTLGLYVTNISAFDLKLEALLRFLIGRPLNREAYPLGSGNWYEMNDERLWVWQFKVPELKKQMEGRGFHLIHRRAGEFSEIQRRVRGPLRNALLHLNNICYRMGIPPRLAIANLLVFRKATN